MNQFVYAVKWQNAKLAVWCDLIVQIYYMPQFIWKEQYFLRI